MYLLRLVQEVATMTKFHQRCIDCGTIYNNGYVRNCKCGGLIPFKYHNTDPEDFPDRSFGDSPWRYHQVLPLNDLDYAIDLGMKKTPFLKSKRIAEAISPDRPMENLYIKVEAVQPTRTFKDREAFMTVSRLQELGHNRIVTATTGDSGLAHARACSIAGVKLYIYAPENARERSERMLDEIRSEIDDEYVEVIYSGTTFDEAIANAMSFAKKSDIPLEYGFYNQLRIEGIKTIGFEVLEDLGRVPDWYVQAVGSGVGLYGFRKACMERYGVAPRLAGIQPKGCAPMVRAFKGYDDPTEKTVDTHVLGIGNPKLYLSYPHLINAGTVFEYGFSGGKESELMEIPRLLDLYHGDGVPDVGLESCTALSGLEHLVKSGAISPDETVVLMCSGGMRCDLPEELTDSIT